MSGTDPGPTTRPRQDRDTALQRIIGQLAVSGEGARSRTSSPSLSSTSRTRDCPASPPRGSTL